MRVILLILVFVNLYGCSDFSLKDSLSGISDYFTGGADNTTPPNPLTEINPEVQIDVLWKESVGDGSNEQTLKLVPAIADDRIYAADAEGLVQARNKFTGDLIWEVELENQNEDDIHFTGGPGLGSGTVILGSNNGEVFALNRENGSTLWQTSVSSEVLSVPVVTAGLVIIRTTDGAVVALDEKTGQKKWSYEHAIPALIVRGIGKPLVLGDTLIEGYDNGKLLALHVEDGKYIWETSLAIPKGRSEVERLVDVDVDPVETRGTVYTASYSGGTAAVSATNGEALWRNEDVSSYTGLSHDSQYIYISNLSGNVLQLDQTSGASLWEQKDLLGRKTSAPSVYQNYVVVGDYDGYVHWLSNTDGRVLGREHIADDGIDAKPIIDGDTVYIYAKDGTLAALKAH